VRQSDRAVRQGQRLLLVSPGGGLASDFAMGGMMCEARVAAVRCGEGGFRKVRRDSGCVRGMPCRSGKHFFVAMSVGIYLPERCSRGRKVQAVDLCSLDVWNDICTLSSVVGLGGVENVGDV